MSYGTKYLVIWFLFIRSSGFGFNDPVSFIFAERSLIPKMCLSFLQSTVKPKMCLFIVFFAEQCQNNLQITSQCVELFSELLSNETLSCRNRLNFLEEVVAHARVQVTQSFLLLLLVSHLRLNQRIDDTAEGWLNHFIVITLLQQQLNCLSGY